MTTKALVLSMVDFLSAGLADQTECSRSFDETMIELAHDPRAWCSQVATMNTGLTTNTSDPDQLEIRSAVIKLLSVFYSGRELSEETIQNLAGTNVNWREQYGDPWAYTRQGEEGRILRLFPKPRRVPVTGEAFSTYTDSAIVLYCDARTTAIPDILCLPLALLVLAREFERESNHRDIPFAEAWRAMGQNMLKRIY
jgi:hypothetical protein